LVLLLKSHKHFYGDRFLTKSSIPCFPLDKYSLLKIHFHTISLNQVFTKSSCADLSILKLITFVGILARNDVTTKEDDSK